MPQCSISRCSNGRTAGGQYSCPIRNCFRLRCVFVGVSDVFFPVVYAHAARPRALSLRKNNEVERYASSLPPFVSVSPIEWYVYTPVPNELSINLFEKVCCAIERAKFLHSATPRPYPWHTSFYRALPRCFRSYF